MSDLFGLATIWIGCGAPAGSGQLHIDAGVAWIEVHGAPGAPQLIPHREGGWALCSRCAMNSQSGEQAMTACPLCIVLATKLRMLDYCCSLTATTAALLIVSPLMMPFLPPPSSITTPQCCSLWMAEEYNKMLWLEEYKLVQQVIL